MFKILVLLQISLLASGKFLNLSASVSSAEKEKKKAFTGELTQQLKAVLLQRTQVHLPEPTR